MTKLKVALIWCLLAVLSGCAPTAEPNRILVAPPATSAAPTQTPSSETPTPIIEKTSECVSSPTAPFSGLNATYETKRLNADTSIRIANLEYLISQIDPNYSCGTFFQETSTGTIRSIRVYKVSQGAQAYNSSENQLESAFGQLNLPYKASVVLLTDFSGLLPKVIVKTGWGTDEVAASDVKANKRALYTRLAMSDRTLFSPIAGLSQSSGDLYNCEDFSTQAAAQAFFGGLGDDVNRLDADNDGVACEALDNISRSYKVTLADLPAPAVSTVPTTRTYTPSSPSSGRCYVSGYTRKNGTRVSGYYRRC